MQNSNIKTKPVVFPLSEEKQYVTRGGDVVTLKRRNDNKYPFIVFNEHGEYFRTVTESGRWGSDDAECQSDIVAEVVPDSQGLPLSQGLQWKFEIGDVLAKENNTHSVTIGYRLTDENGKRYYSGLYQNLSRMLELAEYIEREFVKVG